MTAVNEIFKALNKTFTDLDAKMIVDQKAWAAKRVAAIKEFKEGSEVAKRRADRSNMNFSTWYYQTLFAIAGGKTWYNIFNGRNEAMINEFIEKNCKAIAEKRNANIARKLNDAGVTAVTTAEVATRSDGFNGTFKVETNVGPKIVNIETIYAGGYNIQCYHQRTLVKVR